VLNPGIIVFGAAGIDFIANVLCFPEQDSKIRTTVAKQLVGGNAANTSAGNLRAVMLGLRMLYYTAMSGDISGVLFALANILTALARLGMHCRLFSKVGTDANANFLRSMLSHVMGVIVDDVVVDNVEGEDGITPTAFTYVIVASQSLSRTCIHTPLRHDINHDEVTMFIDRSKARADFKYIHFDSRHTTAAVEFAESLRSDEMFGDVVCSIDVEKNRPHIKNLINQCHIIFTNKKSIKELFPDFCGERDKDYLEQASAYFSGGCCELVVLTDGARGSMLLFANDDLHGSNEDNEAMFADVCFHDLYNRGRYVQTTSLSTSELKACFNVMLEKNILAVEYDTLQISSSTDTSHSSYGIIRCSSFKVHRADIVDTTGAGDAFIGGFLFGVMQRFSLQECMFIGTIVATEKLYALGAQTNLPTLERVLDVIATRASDTYIIAYTSSD